MTDINQPKEFNLSDKIFRTSVSIGEPHPIISVEDVKEFIKQCEERSIPIPDENELYDTNWISIQTLKKFAGDKLK